MAIRKVDPVSQVKKSTTPPSTGFQKGIDVANQIGSSLGIPTQAWLNKPVLSGAARAVEAVGGIPGNIAQTVSDIAGVQNKVPLPTSQNLRDVTKQVTGDSLEPQGELEGAYQEFIGDLAALAAPLPGIGGMGLGKAAKLAGLGTGASRIAKALGADEGVASLAKGSAMVLGSLYGGRKVLTDQMNSLYNTATKTAEGAIVDAKDLSQSLNSLSKEMNTGILTPAKEGALKAIEPIGDSIVKNTIQVPLLVQLDKDINSMLRDRTLKESWPHLKRINGFIQNTLKKYGQINKEFGESYPAAKKLYAGLEGSLKATQFIRDRLPDSIVKNDLTKHLLGLLGVGSAYSNPLKTAATAAGAGAASWVARTAQLMYDSPLALKWYSKALKEAAEGNLRATARSVENLDKVVGRFEEKNPKRSRIRKIN